VFKHLYPAEPVQGSDDGSSRNLRTTPPPSCPSRPAGTASFRLQENTSSIMSITPSGNRLLSPTPGQRGVAGWGSPSRAGARTANAQDGKSKICARCFGLCEGNLRFSCGRRVALCLKCTSSFVKLLDQRAPEEIAGVQIAARSNTRRAELRSRSSLSPSRVSNGEDATQWSHPLLRTPQPLGAAALPRILHARPVVETSAEPQGTSSRVLHRPAGRARGQSPSRSSGPSPEPRVPFSRSPGSSRRLAPPKTAFAGVSQWISGSLGTPGSGEAAPAMPFPTSPIHRACGDERMPLFDPLPARRRVVRAEVQPVPLGPLSPFRYAAHSSVSERRERLAMLLNLQ